MKTIIESIRDYFNECELLEDEARLNIDFLGSEPIEYGIYAEPIEPTLKRYVDGAELRQFAFIFTTRNIMSGDLVVQLENSGFFDRLIDWVEQRNKRRIYPILEGDKYSTGLEINSNGYLLNSEGGTAQYQIQFKLIYYMEG